jgi:hypothetical protein
MSWTAKLVIPVLFALTAAVGTVGAQAKDTTILQTNPEDPPKPTYQRVCVVDGGSCTNTFDGPVGPGAPCKCGKKEGTTK